MAATFFSSLLTARSFQKNGARDLPAQPVQRDCYFALPPHRGFASLFPYNDLSQFTHLLGEQLDQIVERDDSN